MRAFILLICAAAAAAAYIPGHGYQQDQAHRSYHDEQSAKHDYNKGVYGQDASAYRDSNSGQVQGEHNLQHRDQYTALKHNLEKYRDVIKHKSDDHKEGAYGHQYAQAAGGTYSSGADKHYSDKGHDGKYVGHVNSGYGHGYNAYNADQNNAYANQGYAAHGQYGAQQNHQAGTVAGGHSQKSYVDHSEVLDREKEDYAFKDVKHEKDLHTDFYNKHASAANKGHANSHYSQAIGHDSKQHSAQGHEQSAADQGKGHSQLHSSANYAAGQTHQDHDAKHGSQQLNYDNGYQQQAAGYNLHGNEKNSYHIKTRKVQKLEHEVNHKDGRSEDSYWNNQHNQGQYGLHGAYQNAGHAASRDHAYNYNHQAAYQPYYSHALY